MTGRLRADIVVDRNSAWLELPERSLRVPEGGSIFVTSQASDVRQVVLHLPQGGSHVSYGMLHTKVNTEPSDVAMQSLSVADGIVLRLDLTAGAGFPFKTGRNSVELAYQDQFGRSRYFNFLLNFGGGDAVAPGLQVGQEPTQASAPPVRGRGRLFAVVIGISKYLDPTGRVKSLQYADKDALAFVDFLRSPAAGGIDGDHLLLLLNEDATAKNVRHALFSFLTQPQPEDTVIIYIAGHGAHDPQEPRNLYLLTADTDPSDVGGTAFPMWQMQDVFSRIVKAKKVITIADTCHSYGFSGADETTAKKPPNNLFNQYMERYGASQEQAVITASDISEMSFEDARWGGGHGVFTYYVLRGLAGEADRNHDGNVTTGELFRYVQTSVRSETVGKQNPRAMAGLDRSLILSRIAKTGPN